MTFNCENALETAKKIFIVYIQLIILMRNNFNPLEFESGIIFK